MCKHYLNVYLLPLDIMFTHMYKLQKVFTIFIMLPGCCTVKVLGLAAKFGDIIGGGQ